MKLSKGVSQKDIERWKKREVIDVLTSFICKGCGIKVECHIKIREAFGDWCYSCKPENLYKLPRRPVLLKKYSK